MFEKESEEIANKKLCSERICYNHCNFNSPKHHRCGEWHRIYDCAKESAEFGYNKSKEELEEENAELKEQCSILADCNTCHSTCKNENIEMKKQLTKAKELIEELSSSLSVVGECEEEECELLNRAEQFIKE